MRSRRQFPSFRRSENKKQPKSKIIIYAEGERTEYDYFNQIRSKFRSSLIDLEIIGGQGVPLTIAKKAASAVNYCRKYSGRNSYANRDEFWVVFDRDDHPNLNEAFEICKKNNIQVGFSDPCFELWLILHFQTYDKPDDRNGVQKFLEKLCPGYNRVASKTANFQPFMDNLNAAESRAEKQFDQRSREGSPPRRPFTTVFNLTRRIQHG